MFSRLELFVHCEVPFYTVLELGTYIITLDRCWY